MIEYTVYILIIAAFLMLVVRRDSIAIGAIVVSFLVMVSEYMGGGAEIVRFGGWIPPFGIVWVADNLSLFIGLLITGMSSLVAIYSARHIRERKERFYALLCLMTAGLMGVALTGDLFNMYVFFEILSVASYGLVSFFLDEHAIEGAFKYIIMGSFGSSFILIGIALIYGLTGTLNLAHLAISISLTPGFLIPLGLIIGGFALKAALIPFHAWKPDAIEGTPSPIGAIFTTVSSAIGIYGIVRILFVFGLIEFNYMLVFFGVATMVTGALLALVQINVKRMLAYSSISQMGYIAMAIGFGTTLGLTSGLYHILNNAVIKGLLFMGIGSVMYVTRKENLDEMGIEHTPLMVCVGIGVLSMAGMPLLNGFASKWLIFMASWEISPVLTVIALVSSAITFAYGMKIFSSIFMCSGRESVKIPKIMIAPVITLTAICVVMGVFPQLGLAVVEPAVNAIMDQNQYIMAVLGG